MEAGGGASGLLLANPGMEVGLDVGKPPRMFGFMLDVSILHTLRHSGVGGVWFFDRVLWCEVYRYRCLVLKENGGYVGTSEANSALWYIQVPLLSGKSEYLSTCFRDYCG